ncbi:MAG: hydrogenase expression/formation protein HypE [Calditrichia bacterium]
MEEKRILLSHGSGGKLSHQLIEEFFLPLLKNEKLEPLDDSAVIELGSSSMVFSTDSYVVDPIFFPGGDIGKLAVCGTINDLAVMGAVPQHLSLSLILEEGFLFSDLQRIMQSVANTCKEAGVSVITGDTKVVPRGFMDKVFINTSGVGFFLANHHPNRRIENGDKILINGTIGDHGTTILASREGIQLQSAVQSDCAPLNGLIAPLLDLGDKIHLMRDPTRGGVATTLNELVKRTPWGAILYEENLPFKKEVLSLCEILGLDPLYLANEGKVIAVVHPEAADEVLRLWKAHPLGRDAAIVGEIVDQFSGKVVLETQFGSRRIIDMLTGEQLPRIC